MASIRLFKQNIPSTIVLLAAIEALLFIASVYGAAYIRFWGDSLSTIQHATGNLPPRAVIFVTIMMLSMLALGLYRRWHIVDRGGMESILPRIAISHLMGSLALAAIFYIFPDLSVYRGVYLIAAALALIGTAVTRAIFFKFADHKVFKRRVLVYGVGVRADEIKKLADNQASRSMFKVINYLRCNKSDKSSTLENAIDLPAQLLPFCAHHSIDEIVIATTDRRKNLPVDELLKCKMNGINIINAADFFERETGAFRVDMLSHDSFIFSDGFKTSTARAIFKRSFDILLALLVMPLAVLTLPIAALCILLEDGWGAPILFRQQRIGAGGKTFEILKIRSMKVDDGARQQFATENDERITRVGRVIRKIRIDELPQLFNVLQGEMSFIGPRPEQPAFVKNFIDKINYYNERHTVKPGITGWAQVKHNYTDDDIPQTTIKLQLDLYYVKNHSLLFDLFIIIQTVEIVLFKLGPR